MVRISFIPIVVLLLLVLTACSSGIPQEELDAVNALLQEERARTAVLEVSLLELEQLEARLKQASHLEAARRLMSDGWELSGAQVLGFLAAVESSADAQLKAGVGELLQGSISSLDSLPPELVGQALAAVQGAGDLQVADAVQALLFAAALGGGGPELLAVALAVHASQSQALEDVVSSILSEVLGQQGTADLTRSINDLASASTDPAVQEALEKLRQPPEDFIRAVQEHLDAAGVSDLQNSFRQAYLPPDGDPSAFFEGVAEELRRTLEIETTDSTQ